MKGLQGVPIERLIRVNEILMGVKRSRKVFPKERHMG